MLSILDKSATLKDHECDMQSSDSQIMPSPNVLYSDEMTRSVPSIRSQSSQEFITCASFNSGRRNSRKGRPNRSCSWQDAAPGIVFKFNDDSQTILVIPNNMSSRDLEKINIFDRPEKQIRSQSITSLGSYIPFSNRSRPRSFSIDCTSFGGASSLFPSFNEASNISSRRGSESTCVNEVDEEEYTSENCRETRKSSISSMNSTYSAVSQKKKFNAAGNSLSHLVPNKLLSSISRRISANSSHELCRCSSCNQSVTPYWRDGWADDVMLCNACGLRFQKFAQRCMYCKYIPRKEDGVEDTCPQCQAPWEC
jgi:hypothetical protein